ncbi:ABC transporter substrate-binding protein [Casimicrobium huifangae]|uniref:ABC transporter substrate-binding protein n=1 Tax=Casimicrobium huifangae TaxID=2591109 RepID=UPI003783D649
MKFSIRKSGAVLVGLALVTAFAAGASAQELRFSWWGGGERHEAMLKAARLFEAKNPGVKIKAEYSGFQGYQERLSTQIAGRNEPDVMQVNWAWLSAFSKNGEGFYDLRKAGAAVKTSEFSEHDLALTTINGKLNALPVGFTARIFYWNKAVLDKAGVPMPKTWDDLFTAGKAFRAKVGDKGYLLDGNLYDLILVSHAYAYQKHGTPWIDARTGKIAMSAAALKDWVAFYKRLQDENVATAAVSRESRRRRKARRAAARLGRRQLGRRLHLGLDGARVRQHAAGQGQGARGRRLPDAAGRQKQRHVRPPGARLRSVEAQQAARARREVRELHADRSRGDPHSRRHARHSSVGHRVPNPAEGRPPAADRGQGVCAHLDAAEVERDHAARAAVRASACAEVCA